MPTLPAIQVTPAAETSETINGGDVEVEVRDGDENSEGRRDSQGSLGSQMKRKTTLILEMEQWSHPRLALHAILKHHYFDMIMGAIIVTNMCFMIIEANTRAQCYPVGCRNHMIEWVDRILVLIYTVECICRAYVDQKRYLPDKWNLLDLGIVVIGWFDEIITLITMGDTPEYVQMLPLLRILRVGRLIRAVRLLRFYPQLYILVRGFVGAMKAMFWGFVLIILLTVVWSWICVELINPVNMRMNEEKRARGEEVNEFCEAAFKSVLNAVILLFQAMVAGDAWGQCTVPLIHFQKLTFIVFGGALVTVSLGLMNLILAVIVDHAAAARDGDREEKAKEKKKEEEQALKKWKNVIKKIDVDGSGTISLMELMDGYEVPEVRETLEIMGIDKEDLKAMFKLMDEDGSGDLNYDEFIDAFLKAQGQDLRIYLMMTKLQMDNVAKTAKRIAKELHDSFGDITAQASATTGLGPVASFYNNPGAMEKKMIPQIKMPPVEPITEVSFDADFQMMNTRISEQFQQLAKSVHLNTATLARHTEMLEAAIDIPAQASDKGSAGTATDSKVTGGVARGQEAGRWFTGRDPQQTQQSVTSVAV